MREILDSLGLADLNPGTLSASGWHPAKGRERYDDTPSVPYSRLISMLCLRRA